MEAKDFERAGKKAVDNHIWLNAFSCINPDKDFAAKLGFEILRMLDDKEKLTTEDGIAPCDMLYLSVNKS